MSSFHRIVGIPGLEGTIIEADHRHHNGMASNNECDLQYVCVLAFISPNTVVGDRALRFPVPPNALFIDDKFVVPAEDPNKEYTAKSPFGKHLYEGRFTKEGLEIVTVEYDNAVTVTIIEKNPPQKKGLDRTVYTQNFFEDREQAKEMVAQVLTGTWDIDDLVFELKALKDEEAK